MRRRKNPIILITVLVVCAGAVFVMSSGSANSSGGEGAPPPPSEDTAPKTGANTPSISKDQIHSMVSSEASGKGSGPAMKGGHMPPGMPGGPPEDPSILNRKMAPFAPKPSDTNVNAGWYQSEAPSSYTPPAQAKK